MQMRIYSILSRFIFGARRPLLLAAYCYWAAFSAEAQLAVWGSNFYNQTNVPAYAGELTSISLGSRNAIALRRDGTVIVWGDNTYNQTNVPAGLIDVVAVAAGSTHMAALQRNGTVIAWGDNTHGQTNVPVGLNDATAISAGAGFTIALRKDGSVVGWGELMNAAGHYVPLNIPAGLTNVTALASAASHILALHADGTVVGWGRDVWGETRPPANLTNAIAIATGTSHSLALLTDGTVVGWGANTYGESAVPPGLGNVVGIAAGGYHNLAVTRDGRVIAWGRNNSGQTNVSGSLGKAVAVTACADTSAVLAGTGAPALNPLMSDRLAPREAGCAIFEASATGEWPLGFQWQHENVDLPNETNRTLVLAEPALDQSGSYRVIVSNRWGWTASEPAQLRLVPVLVQEGLADTTAYVGNSTTLKLNARGSGTVVYQWSFQGKDLPGETESTLTLTNVQWQQQGQYSAWASNDLGMAHGGTMALTVQQVAVAGEWYDGTNWDIFTLPPGLGEVVQVAGGLGNAVALRRDGTVVSWGEYLSVVASPAPALPAPPGLSNVVAVSAGGRHHLALIADGTVFAWGTDKGCTNIPAKVTNIVAIASGDQHNLALKADGTLFAWGSNSASQLSIPSGLTNIVAIAAGGFHSMALKADGTVRAWGSGSAGQTRVPTGLTGVVQIAAGENNSMALRADGSVVVWGPTGSTTNIPTSVHDVQFIACGGYSDNFCLAVRKDGTVVAWGDAGAQFQTNLPPGLSNAVSVAAGGYNSMVVLGSGAPFLLPGLADRGSSNGLGKVIFRVQASGAPPLRYQWMANGTNLPGATSNCLEITNAGPEHRGDYSVVVSNSLGQASTETCRLMVPCLTAWGNNLYHECDIPWQLEDAIEVSAGPVETFVLRADGSLVSYGYVTPPPVTNGLVAVSAGNSHRLALRTDGTVVAWGAGLENLGTHPDYGQSKVPAGLSNVVAIAAGGFHSMALRRNGTVVVWGGTGVGETYVPATLENVIEIAAGDTHCLALTADGRVRAWGNPSAVPVDLDQVVAIAAGYKHSLALKSDGTVVSWGAFSSVPVGLQDVVAISAGQAYSTALRADGSVVCWGNAPGMLVTNIPPGLHKVAAISSGLFHNVALLAHGPPRFTRPQLSRYSWDGSPTCFYAPALGQWPVHYQWLCNGTNIPNATNAFLVVASAGVAKYRVKATNAAGETYSEPVEVTRGLPHLVNPRSTPSGFRFDVVKAPGMAAGIFTSTNLIHWTNTGAILDQTFFTDPDNLPYRFYRIEQWPQ